MTTINEQRQRSADLVGRLAAIQARGDEQQRELNEQEAAEFDATYQEYEAVLADIDRRQRLEASNAYLQQTAQAAGPLVATNGNGNGNGAAKLPTAAPAAPAPAAVPAVTRGHRITVENRAAGNWGFRDSGEFFQAVRNACIAGRPADPRLLNQGPDNVMTEGVPADGGYLVPPDYRTDILSLLLAEDALLPLTDMITTSSNQVIIPVDATAPWQTTGGIQAYWGTEAGLKQTSKAVLDQVAVRLNKLYVLVPVSDELVEDAPALGALLRRKAPEVMDWKVTDAILNGTGNGQPQGIYTSTAALIVTREAGQAAKTISYQNVVKVWSSFYSSATSRGTWIMGPDTQAALMGLYFPITGASGTVGGFPAYLPPGGLSAAPYGTLLGRPIFVTDAAPALGQTGDLALCDLKAYLTVVKAGGIKQDVSIHIWFNYDVSCFRFVLRVGGAPFWKAPVTGKGGGKRSPFVLLGGDGVTAEEAERGAAGAERERHGETEHPAVEGTRRSNEATERMEREQTKRR